MRAVVQRVRRAQVRVEGETIGAIDRGLVALVGVGTVDRAQDAHVLAEKIVGLRIFEDEAGKMNRSLLEEGGALLAISQFTLYGDVRKGKRPAFVEAREPIEAAQLFEAFVEAARALGARVETGRFRADMDVELINEGPVTILVDTHKQF